MKGLSMTYMVRKRNGDVVPFDASKWENQIKKVCEGIEHVSAFTIAATAQAQFKQFMTTEELDNIALRAMVNLIDSEANPLGHTNYQFVAGRQRLTMLRKNIYGSYEVPHIFEIVKKNIAAKLYTEELLEWYTEAEWDEINSFIDHSFDENYVYSQIEQFIDKYLVRNRFTGEILESPQVRYIIAAATAMHAEKKDRMQWIKDTYETSRNGEYSLATPVAAGLGTATKQFSSCVTIKIGDDLDAIYESGRAMAKYAGKRAGIGLEIGMIRGLDASIRNGEMRHTGLVPFVKKWERDLHSVSQGGVRKGAATIYFPIWHWDYESLVVLKNNQGTEETRARHMDYGVQMSAMFWERLVNRKDITLFSPDEVPGLYDAFHQDIEKFEKLYCEYEKNPNVRKKVISADDAIRSLFATERTGTGRIYGYNADNVQFQAPVNPQEDTICQSNLCTEVLIPTEEFTYINSESGLIGLCTLGSLNWGKFKNPTDMRRAVRVLYRVLHNLLQYQDFLVPQSKRHNSKYEPLGIGVTDLAHWHAQRGFQYGEDAALKEVKRFMEHQYLYMMQMNVELAMEKGPCERSHASRYSQGKFIFEMRHPGVNDLTDFTMDPTLVEQYEEVRTLMMKHGVRNMFTGAIAPVESSSLLVHSTNGIALPKSLIANKVSRSGKIVQVVPEYETLKEQYAKLLMWSQDNPRGYLKTAAVLQVYIDQAISCDLFYNPKEIMNEITGQIEMKIDVTEFLGDMILAQNWGIKTLYYCLINKQKLIDRLTSSPQIVSVITEQNTEPPEEEFCEGCTI